MAVGWWELGAGRREQLLPGIGRSLYTPAGWIIHKFIRITLRNPPWRRANNRRFLEKVVTHICVRVRAINPPNLIPQSGMAQAPRLLQPRPLDRFLATTTSELVTAMPLLA